MKNVSILLGAFLLIFSWTSISYAQTSETQLTQKQRLIVPIAALAAQGNMEDLSKALHEGLDGGLTINETKEVLIHVYAYAGFPRSLNGINNLIAVLKEREARGIKDEVGPEASPIPTDRSILEMGTENQTYILGRPSGGPTYQFSPEIDYFLKAHLFGDLFERDVIDFKSREVATVAILSSLGRTENQLRGHINCSLNIGITESQLRDLIEILDSKVGSTEANTATMVLNSVIGK